MPPSDEGGGFCEAKDGGRDTPSRLPLSRFATAPLTRGAERYGASKGAIMKQYNKSNIPLAKTLRKNMTPWERKLWYEFLRNYPVRFQRQKAIGEYIVDFYCAKAKLIIELDGGGHYTQEQIAKDALRSKELEQMDLKILRICNLDIDQNFYGVCQYIDKQVKQRISG